MLNKKILAGIASLLCAASVQAAPMSLSSAFSFDQYLTTGQSQSLQIDVNSALAGKGWSSTSIASGVLTVSGYSAADFDIVSSSVTNLNYSENRTTTDCKNGKCKVVSDNFHIKQFNTSYSDSIADQMKITAGGASATGSADDHNAFDTDSGKIEDLKKQNGSENSGYNRWYNQFIGHYDSLSGDLVVQLSLDALALNDLVSDGILNLTVNSVLGQFNVTDVRLDFVTQDAVPPADTQVPVPTSLLLTGLGLAALATVRRRKA
ncbi:MAG TPA: PEP-CTERM sorting domain-containing protein [Pseudoduganella sp.]